MERRDFLKTSLAAITSVIGIGVMTPVSAQNVANRRILRRQKKPIANKPQTNPAEVPNGNTSSLFAPEMPTNKVAPTKLFDSVSPLSAEDIERIGQPPKPDTPSFSFQTFYEHDELIQRLKKRGIKIPQPEPTRFIFSMPFMR
jgi:hypothetical protein